MIKKLILQVRQKIKEPGLNFLYDFLMSPAKKFQGRRLFGAEELRLLHRALLNQNLFGIDGKMVPAFEKEFAHAYGVPYAVASTSGTAAIHAALGALDLNPADEVITAPITDLGTIIPILYQNAIPVFADVDDTYNMNPADVEKKITSRTKAIIVVHLFGSPCHMDVIVKIAKEHNIVLIEDCAQAHLTEYKGRYAGTIGDIGCFSFQQSKHMTTGDGGMTITSNKDYYERMKLFVDKGYARKGWGARAYLFLAPNYRMNELTAAVGLAQLEKVKQVVHKRQQLGQYLTGLISDLSGVLTIPVAPGAESSYWLYPLRLQNINAELFAEEMRKEKVWVSAGYTGKPIYLCSESLASKRTFGASQFPFSKKITDKTYEYKEGLCPIAEELLKQLICIPLDESWDKARVEKTAKAIKVCIKRLSQETASVHEAKAEKKEFRVIQSDKKENKKIRIGIVGCGQMGHWHLDAYRQNPDVHVAAFADTDFKKAQYCAQRLNANAYRTHAEMIKSERLNGVSVCTVPVTHYEIVLDFLDKGIHVLCEKPLAVSVAQAQIMVGKAVDKNLLLLTAFKFRFFEEVLKVKQMIEKGSFGRILNFRLMFGGYIDMSGSWYGKKDLSGGGIIMDNGPHAFDLIHYLLGDVESVSANLKNHQNLEVEDTAQLTCLLKNGASGIIDLSWSTSVPSNAYLEIYGEEGTALLDLQGITYKFRTWDDWKRLPNHTAITEAFKSQIDHFVYALKGIGPSITTSEDGLKVQLTIEAAYHSVKNGRNAEIVTTA